MWKNEDEFQQKLFEFIVTNLKFVPIEANNNSIPPYRNSTKESVLKDILIDWIYNNNSYKDFAIEKKFSREDIAKKVDELISIDYKTNGVKSANRKITEIIKATKNILVKMSDGREFEKPIKFIDFNNPENNKFHITREYFVSTNAQSHLKQYRVPDLVLFINGIPIVSIELKIETNSINEAIGQLRDGIDGDESIPNFYKFVQILIASNSTDFKYGTIGMDGPEFMSWTEDETSELYAKYKNEKLSNFAYLLDKSRLVNFVKKFIFYSREKKIIARHNQYFAVEKTLKRIENIEKGKRKGGVIYHTQGTGKSITMFLIIDSILKKYKAENPKIFIVTDRNDLDDQISETMIKTTLDTSRVKQVKNGKELLDEINSNNDVVTAVINKFDSVAKTNKKILSKNIFILVDEAHRSVSGIFFQNLELIFPNACFIAFTGTPILSDEKIKTIERFGDYIDVYNITSATKDKVIVPLTHISKFPLLSVASQEAIKPLMNEFVNEHPNLSEEDKKKLTKKYTNISTMLGFEKRLEEIAKDIVIDFKQHEVEGFKALFAVSSRYDATRYYDFFKKMNLDYKIAYLITGDDSHLNSYSDEEIKYESFDQITNVKWKEYLKENNYGEKSAQKLIIEKFKKTNSKDEIKLLIVVDKLLTGFDVPSIKVLYLDKFLREHGLLQAIARANRIYPNKDNGYIVDYRGLGTRLKEALAKYSSNTINQNDSDDILAIKDAFKQPIEVLESFNKILNFIKNELFSDCKYPSTIIITEETEKKARQWEDDVFDILKENLSIKEEYYSNCSSLKAFFESLKMCKKILIEVEKVLTDDEYKILQIEYFHIAKVFLAIKKVSNDYENLNKNIENEFVIKLQQALINMGVSKFSKETKITNVDFLETLNEFTVKQQIEMYHQEIKKQIMNNEAKDPEGFALIKEKLENAWTKYKEIRKNEQEELERYQVKVDLVNVLKELNVFINNIEKTNRDFNNQDPSSSNAILRTYLHDFDLAKIKEDKIIKTIDIIVDYWKDNKKAKVIENDTTYNDIERHLIFQLSENNSSLSFEIRKKLVIKALGILLSRQ